MASDLIAHASGLIQYAQILRRAVCLLLSPLLRQAGSDGSGAAGTWLTRENCRRLARGLFSEQVREAGL